MHSHPGAFIESSPAYAERDNFQIFFLKMREKSYFCKNNI